MPEDATDQNKSGGNHLDSHVNMIVVGGDCYIISRSDITAVVNASTDDVGTIEVPIVDALIVYEDDMTGNSYYLIARNVLYVKSMQHNLIPPFIMREAELIVNEQAKIHTSPDTVSPKDHSIIDHESGLHIQMELYDTFSGFYTRAPTAPDTIREDNKVIKISLGGDSWNPHSSHYSGNEKSLIHSFCEIMNKKYAFETILEDDLSSKEKYDS